MDERINFINMTIKVVNDYVDDIYEDLVDENYDDCERSVDSLVEILLDIKTTFIEEL